MESSSRTLVCSVLFLDIAEYSKKAVADQLQLKQAFNQALATALEQVPARDRIILDTGDGAAVTFMGDPEDALFAAMAVRDGSAAAQAALPVRLGINLGPVRLVKDLNGQMNIIGDGINVAQRVMSFSSPGQLLVSRSFYEVVSCLSRDYQNLFRHEGSRTDKHVREHEVYSVVGAPAGRRAQTDPSLGIGGWRGWLHGTGPLGVRRSALLAAPAAFVALLIGGLALGGLLGGRPAEASAQSEAMPASTPAPRIERPRLANASDLAKPAAVEKSDKKRAVDRLEKKLQRLHVARAEANAATSPATGRVVLAVAPWGEVLVDGQSRGVSPPVQMVELSAGPHDIELRNGDFPSFQQKIVVKPGEPVRIRHRFR